MRPLSLLTPIPVTPPRFFNSRDLPMSHHISPRNFLPFFRFRALDPDPASSWPFSSIVGFLAPFLFSFQTKNSRSKRNPLPFLRLKASSPPFCPTQRTPFLSKNPTLVAPIPTTSLKSRFLWKVPPKPPPSTPSPRIFLSPSARVFFFYPPQSGLSSDWPSDTLVPNRPSPPPSTPAHGIEPQTPFQITVVFPSSGVFEFLRQNFLFDLSGRNFTPFLSPPRESRAFCSFFFSPPDEHLPFVLTRNGTHYCSRPQAFPPLLNLFP